MRTYQKLSLITIKGDDLLVKAQGTPPLICSGDFPASCNLTGIAMESLCFPGSSIQSTFLVPGLTCADPLIQQCTVTVNGQAVFCDGGAVVDETQDCAGDGCAVELDCIFAANSCSGGETVEISCPGFEGCTQTVVLAPN